MASKRPADAPSASIGCHRSLCGSNSGKKRTAPSRSCTLAAVTSSAQIRPRVSTPRWRLRPLTFFQRHSQEFSQVRSALFFRRLHRLAVDNNDGGSGFFTRRKARLAAQRRTLRRRGAPCGAEAHLAAQRRTLRRRGAPCGAEAHLAAQRRFDLLDQAVFTPLMLGVRNGRIGRKVAGQKPPLAARSHQIQKGIDNPAIGNFAGSSDLTGFSVGKKAANQLPFEVGKIGLISVLSLHKGLCHTNATLLPNFRTHSKANICIAIRYQNIVRSLRPYC